MLEQDVELLDWHRLAVKLGKTIPELKTGKSRMMWATEWLYWRAFMQLEPNLFDPIHYYFAALTAEVARGHSKKGAKGLSLKDRLIKFVLKKIKREDSTPVEEEVDPKRTMKDYNERNDNRPRTPDGRLIPPDVVSRMRSSKAAWFAAAGLNTKGEYTRKKRKAAPLPPHVKQRKR